MTTHIPEIDDSSLSVIVPAYNEQGSIAELYDELKTVLDSVSPTGEIIFVDDGSTDGTGSILKDLARNDPSVTVIVFRRNFGKAAALDAGFRRARGDVVLTIDGDLQDDPNEIPRFLEKIREGHDVVSGWKVHRLDPIDKTLPSKVFNRVVSAVSGVRLNDFNCGFKAYRREAVESIRLYGELHRFVPVLLHWQGFTIGEIEVNHRQRKFGRSKYGAARLIKGFLDLITVILVTRFLNRPLHIFGALGVSMMLVGGVALSYLSLLWLFNEGPIGSRPLLLFGVLFVLAGIQTLTIGLLGEFVQNRTASQSSQYSVREIFTQTSLQDPRVANTAEQNVVTHSKSDR